MSPITPIHTEALKRRAEDSVPDAYPVHSKRSRTSRESSVEVRPTTVVAKDCLTIHSSVSGSPEAVDADARVVASDSCTRVDSPLAPPHSLPASPKSPTEGDVTKIHVHPDSLEATHDTIGESLDSDSPPLENSECCDKIPPVVGSKRSSDEACTSETDLDTSAEDKSDTRNKVEPKTVLGGGVSQKKLLPLELHHLIVEQMWGYDTGGRRSWQMLHTLKACALTCSHWRAAVRPYIFHFLILRSREDFRRLSTQLREEPFIAGWIQKVRLDGKTLPFQESSFGRLKDTKKDLDTALYSFPTTLGSCLSNLKTFELVGFAQVSSRREDCQAFAEWIPRLSELSSVTTLNIVRCEMSPNSLTAIIRALSGLKHVGIIANEMFHPNTSVLQDESISTISLITASSGNPSPDDTSPTTTNGEALVMDTPDHSSDEDRPIAYPLLHPPPILKSLLIDTASYTESFTFDFRQLAGWFNPEDSREHLESLVLGSNVSSISGVFISLGQSPNLSHLQVFSGNVEENCEVDISGLTNLRTLHLYGAEHEWNAEEEIPSIRHFISQLEDNTPRLEEVAVAFHFEDDTTLDELSVLDGILAGEKFSHLKVVRIEFFEVPLCETDTREGIRRTAQKVRAMFPLLEKRAILRVSQAVDVDLRLYPNRDVGAD